MSDHRKQAYLEAMGIGVWRLRDNQAAIAPATRQPQSQPDSQTGSPGKKGTAPQPETQSGQEQAMDRAKTPPGLKIGPGGGGVMLICRSDADSATRLASDINRALGSVPVWAWPQAGAGSVGLAEAVEENLYTTVAIFGDELAGQFFDGDTPASLQSANLVLLPSMQDLQEQAEARRLLWTAFCRSGMVNARDQQS